MKRCPCVLAIGMLLLLLASCGRETKKGTSSATPASFVSRATCRACHAKEDALWRGSQHDLAMQEATKATVLGDFHDASLTHKGVTSRFFERDGRYLVETEGRDGKLHEFPIRYCFGVAPLQQYLVEQPGGRLQVLGLCWDSRPKQQGGQRWFDIHPNERIPPDDPLHWTGRDQNWNFMCSECHSTHLRKRYDAAKDRYDTTWSELDVSCEACHGPGSRHVAWAKLPAAKRPDESGLVVQLDPLDADAWSFATGESTASRKVAPGANTQVETCARCHARRSVLTEDYVYGRPLMDSHRPSLLREGLYYADGQVLDEDYVYGSFLQSRMYHRGVVCTSCHEPHSLRLRAEGNALCVRCHDAKHFDVGSHLHHDRGTAGSNCVDCHMPLRTYMVVDPRRDHSFRVPRPDDSRDYGVPNACNVCHMDKTSSWAANTVVAWFGAKRTRGADWTRAFDAGRRRRASAPQLLRTLAIDTTKPGIVRASALDLLQSWIDPDTIHAAHSVMADPDPLVRMAALSLLEDLPDKPRQRLVAPLLVDPIRAVRIEAVRVLGAATAGVSSAALERATRDYLTEQRVNADRPEAHVNLAMLHRNRGRMAQAEAEFRRALAIEPDMVVARIDLVDLYQQLGRDADGEPLLREGIRRQPNVGALHHALGLLLVRRGRKTEALAALGQAATLAPEEPRFAYAYGIALNSLGQAKTALRVLDQASQYHPGDRDLLFALTTMHRDLGHRDQALSYARSLLALAPSDPAAQSLVASLRQ